MLALQINIKEMISKHLAFDGLSLKENKQNVCYFDNENMINK